MDILEEEAKIFTGYLIGRDVSTQAIQIYKAAMSNSEPNDTDKKLLRFMVSHPWSIGFIDAGLVFHDSYSEARRRLYVMLAILEATTENSDLFLTTKRGPFYIFVIAYTGVRAVFKAALGLLLVKVLV
jgi:hypothetical protein